MVENNDLLFSGHVKNMISDTSNNTVDEERSTHNCTQNFGFNAKSVDSSSNSKTTLAAPPINSLVCSARSAREFFRFGPYRDPSFISCLRAFALPLTFHLDTSDRLILKYAYASVGQRFFVWSFHKIDFLLLPYMTNRPEYAMLYTSCTLLYGQKELLL